MRNIYAIKDRIADDLVGLNMYVLMCFRTDQEAARYFADAINDDRSILNKHPADYALICLGAIKEDGNIRAAAEPLVVITGDTLVALQKGDIPNNAHTPLN